MSLSYAEVKNQLDTEVAEDGGKFMPFDAAFYIQAYSTTPKPPFYTGQNEFKTLEESGLADPLEHYVLYGAHAGFMPNSWFDAAFYRGQYADVQGLSGADLLVHFARFGVDEGRAPSEDFLTFDAGAYFTRNPDVLDAIENDPALAAMFGADETGGVLTPGVLQNAAIGHWLKYGAAEGRVATDAAGTGYPNPWHPAPATAPITQNAQGVVSLNTNGGATTLLTAGVTLDGDDTDGVLRLVGDADVRIDLTNPNAVIRGIDLNGDGTIKANGVENNVGLGSNFNILDAYARNPLNEYDNTNNFFGDIEFDGRGFQGDGVSTDGNIVLGGLGADTIFGGIGNDFLAGGGVAAKRGGGTDTLSGGRNADFFYAELSELDNTDGNQLNIDGGTTSDDVSAGVAQSKQDNDWLLLEADDDDEPVTIVLRDDSILDTDTYLNSTPVRIVGEGTQVDTTGWIATRSGQQVGSLRDVENIDASGNLYGFLNGRDIEIGGRRLDDRDEDSDENYGLGTPAQLLIVGSNVANIVIAGYDNDSVHGNGGNDLLFGGNLQQLFDTFDGATNPNLDQIVNDGRDELFGGAGDDNIIFEADGGVIHGGDYNSEGDLEDAGNDTLWLTKYSLGTKDVADVTTDGVLRFDLLGGPLLNEETEANVLYAGYGGADLTVSHDQTNYSAGNTGMRVSVGGMENVDATGLGGIDYLAAGANDPELNFNNQQNHWGYNGDLDLRGTQGANNLYAGNGDDVIEGRGGRDDMMGGQGNDDFYFAIDGDFGEDSGGDSVDIIRRKVDADGNGLWDVDAASKVVWGQDFGLDQDSTVGSSALQIRITSPSNPGAELGQIINRVAEIRTGVFVDGAFDPIVLNTDAIRAADTYEALRDAINEALAETAYAEELSAELSSDGVTILIVDALGRDLADEQSEADAGVDISQLANTITENVFQFGEPEVQIAQDRLIYKAYEDRSDNEGVDDDGITGSTISLGTDAYAEDLVVSFGADGTRIAEDQSYSLTFGNLTTEDVVQVTVNGVIYKLQVGVALNGTQVDDEDGVGDTQVDIQDAFLQRFANFINSFMDDDTAAGRVVATYMAPNTIVLTQAAYDGEETVFMTTPVVTLGNQSGGERATVTVTNNSQHEVHLFNFDGRDNKLNSENVLFWGEEQVNRAVLETAAAAGGVLNGSEAQVINGGKDDLVGIVHNLATDDELDENFAVHGDDYLLGGAGVDEINGLTGDDRIRGSLGNDELDGGGDWYYVRRVGETKGTATVLNAYEAQQLDADQDVLDIRLIEQTENGEDMIDGTNYVPYFRDTLIYHQADFTAGVTRFTVTLNNFSGLGDDIVFTNGGAGTVGVDANGDGVIELENVSTFTNFENIRTVSGVGNAVAGDGQGNDTLNVMELSDDAEVGVRYDLTGPAGTAGDVDLIEDTDNNLATDGDRTFRNVIKVDGVENVIFGDGDDILLIDETEAAKNNDITGDLGRDLVVYLNDYADEDNEGDDEPTVTINVGAAHPWPGIGDVDTDKGVDTVVMTEGRVGSVIATDTLRAIEEITLGGNTAAGIREDDELNVEALVAGASVNYLTGEIYSDTDGDFDWDDGVLQLTVNNLVEIENVVADGRDAVIVADGAVMSTNARSDSWSERADILINSYLNYDLLDMRGAAPSRLSIGELRAIAPGTADTATEDDIPEVRNFAQFTFDLGIDVDTVDYSNETGDIVSVVNFNAEDTTQYVMVDNNTSGGFRGADDRIDRLIGVENIVASLGQSTIDLTNSTQSLEITFSREIIADTANDRAIHRVQLSNLDTDARLAQNFIEYRDADNDDTIDAFANAVWNTIQGSDFNERVELTDAETEDDHNFFLRGGDNEVNYNELTRSIAVTIGVVDYDEVNPDTSGLITADVTFTDGNLLTIGGQDRIESYSAQNEIAEGSLRIEASQDAEDSLNFSGDLTKLFILGEVVDGSDQITVTLGDAGQQNSLVLTGFELLQDADTDDVYEMDDLSRVLNNLTLVDNGVDDRDTIKVNDDAVGFQASPADTISLEVLNDEFGFDFDILDVTLVTENNLLIVGDTDAGRDLDDDVIVGNLDRIDSITLFDNIWFTNASIASAGNEYVLDTIAGELEDGDSALFTTNATGLNFSLVTGTGVEVDVEGAVAATIVGSNQADTITGGGGDDTITGGGGADVLDGGTATEVRSYDLVGLLAADGNFASFDFLGQGNVVLTEALVAETDYSDGTGAVVDGAGLSVVGPALANLLNSNLAQVNADWQAVYGPVDETITGVTYSAGVLTFTFGAGQDVDNGNTVDLGYADGGDTGTFLISAESVVSEGGSGGVDTFVFAATAAANGADTINGFVALDSATADDLLDFTAFLGAVADTGGAAVDFAAGLDLTADNVGVVFNKANGTLSAADVQTAAAAGKIAVADNGKVVVLVTADVDGVAADGVTDTSNESYNVYYIEDTDATGAQSFAVTLVGTLNSGAELNAADFFGTTDAFV